MRFSIPTVVTAAIAALGVAGLLALALSTDAGSAPGNGQQVFDAPGCLPKAYDGPGRKGRYLISRNCPRPQPVILRKVGRSGNTWTVVWSGERSYDPMGGRLVDFEWSLEERGEHRKGRKIVVHYRRPGPHSVVLYVTNDSGLYGTRRQTVRLP